MGETAVSYKTQHQPFMILHLNWCCNEIVSHSTFQLTARAVNSTGMSPFHTFFVAGCSPWSEAMQRNTEHHYRRWSVLRAHRWWCWQVLEKANFYAEYVTTPVRINLCPHCDRRGPMLSSTNRWLAGCLGEWSHIRDSILENHCCFLLTESPCRSTMNPPALPSGHWASPGEAGETG